MSVRVVRGKISSLFNPLVRLVVKFFIFLFVFVNVACGKISLWVVFFAKICNVCLVFFTKFIDLWVGKMANGYLRRKIDGDLISWMKEENRKPLLLRGARQVGKSSSVRHLAEHFEYFVEVNFEFDKNALDLFAKGGLSPQQLCQELSLIYETPIIPGKTLLFLDEIQSSLPAISA